MSCITLCSGKLGKRIQEINYSNEMLSHGISELEALYLRMQSGTGSQAETNQANDEASLLNRKNHSLAHAINEALKEVESTLREQMETGLEEIDKEIIHEFTIVLRESIRIFHEYRLIQEGYQQRLQQSYKSSFYHYTTNEKRKNRNLPIVQQFHRLVKSICVCGAGTSILR